MKMKRKLEYLAKAIRYLCLAIVLVLGLLTIMATGGGSGSSGSSSTTTLISEVNVTVQSRTATPTPIQGAQVRGVFLYQAANLTEESNCVTDASGKCIVTVTMAGQLADEVTLTVSQPNFYPATDKKTLDSTGSINVTVYMSPTVP